MAVTSLPQCKEAGRRPSFSRPQHNLELPIIFPSLPWGKGAAQRIPGLCRDSSLEALSNPCQTCICHDKRIYNMPPAGKRAIAPDVPAMTFLNLPLATKAFPCVSRLTLLLGKILGLSFFSSEVVSGKTEATQVEKTATPASGCPRPRAMAGEHCASVPPPLSQCFSAPPSKASN